MSILTTAVAVGLCRETQNQEIAAEQMAVTIRALQTQALEAEREVAAIKARECARLDARLADIRKRHPFLSVERCAELLELEESIT